MCCYPDCGFSQNPEDGSTKADVICQWREYGRQADVLLVEEVNVKSKLKPSLGKAFTSCERLFAGVAAWVVGFVWALPFIIESNCYMVNFEQWYWVDEGIWDTLFFATFPAAVVSIVTLIIVSLRTQQSSPPKPMLTAQGESMKDKPMFFWSQK